MRKTSHLLTLGLLVVSLTAATGSRPQVLQAAPTLSGYCDTSANALNARENASYLIAGSNVTGDYWRTRLGVAKPTDAQVVIVTNDSLCQRAAVAHFRDRTGDTTATLYPVVLIQAGPSLFIIDDLKETSSWEELWVYDTAWMYKVRIND